MCSLGPVRTRLICGKSQQKVNTHSRQTVTVFHSRMLAQGYVLPSHSSRLQLNIIIIIIVREQAATRMSQATRNCLHLRLDLLTKGTKFLRRVMQMVISMIVQKRVRRKVMAQKVWKGTGPFPSTVATVIPQGRTKENRFIFQTKLDRGLSKWAHSAAFRTHLKIMKKMRVRMRHEICMKQRNTMS